MNEILQAKGLKKAFYNGRKTISAVNGVDIEIEKAKVFAVLGPSGSGKSTLLHILGGLDRPDRGNVVLDGIDIYKLSDRERALVRNRRIGFVFQSYHLLSEFDALENVLLPAMIYGKDLRFAEMRAKELLSSIGLKDREAHKPNQLSGGERQRVAIARALINNPDIVLCDEPTGNLDSETGKGICDLIWMLSKEQGKAFLVVTHEPEIAKRADRVYKIRDGVMENRQEIKEKIWD